MLLPIKADTQRGAIFSALNQELLFFLEKACDADAFDRNLFSAQLGDAIWSNEPTKKTFRGLWHELKKFSKVGRHAFFVSLQQCQSLSDYYSDITRSPAQVSKRLSKAIGAVTVHLFSRTSHLTGVEGHCGQTLTQFFAHFCDKNKNVCCVCGTETLAQYRADVNDADQWRGPFDHILAKEKYPGLAIHPDNLLPVCSTCNSKAKLAKDVLYNSEGARRRSFNPYTECAHTLVGIKIEPVKNSPAAKTFFHSEEPVVAEKLATWDEVYCIRNRVDGSFRALVERIEIDCLRPDDLESLKTRIHNCANTYLEKARVDPWNLWKHKLYQSLSSGSASQISELWAAISAHRDDPNCKQEFGI